MTTQQDTAGKQSTMAEVLAAYPGAQRAMFRRYHIGGCASCGFQPTETLEQVCQRNGVDAQEAWEHIQTSHEQDDRMLIAPAELAQMRQADPKLRLVDVRSREEWDAVKLDGAVLLSQPLMQEMMTQWPKDETVVFYDHQGKSVLDAAAYFVGHGFTNIRCLRGGIDAWSEQVDSKVRRYRLG